MIDYFTPLLSNKIFWMTKIYDSGKSSLTERNANALVKYTFQQRSTLLISISFLALSTYVIVNIVIYLRRVELVLYNKIVYTIAAASRPVIDIENCMCAWDSYANVNVVNNSAVLLTIE